MEKVKVIKVVKIFSFAFALPCMAFGIYFCFKNGHSGKGGFETSSMPVQVLSDDAFEAKTMFDVLNDFQVESEKDSVLSYQSYRVKQGDMIGVIAENFGISQDTIISVNNIRQSRLLQIGQYLKIPNMTGILYSAKSADESLESVAEKFKVDLQKCAFANNLLDTDVLSEGQTIFVPDAMLDWVTRQEINGDLFLRPVKRYYLSSYFGWRSSPFTGKRTYHSGIDLAAPTGTAVFASLAGRVSVVDYNETYGNYIIISHHSGYKTLYGHLSAVFVKPGKAVTTATKIGNVGNTGLSTGPHLHFTVFKNGRAVNPLNLLK